MGFHSISPCNSEILDYWFLQLAINTVNTQTSGLLKKNNDCCHCNSFLISFSAQITSLKIESNPFAKGFRECELDDPRILPFLLPFYSLALPFRNTQPISFFPCVFLSSSPPTLLVRFMCLHVCSVDYSECFRIWKTNS